MIGILRSLSLGLLFHVYPYYWTAAGAALALAFLIDRGYRAVYFWTGGLGLLVGAPRIFWDLMLKQETGTKHSTSGSSRLPRPTSLARPGCVRHSPTSAAVLGWGPLHEPCPAAR